MPVFSWHLKSASWVNKSPGARTLVATVRTEWFGRREAGFYEKLSTLESVEHFATYCFESIIPSVPGIRKIPLHMMWDLILVGIGETRTVPIDELNEVGTELAQRMAGFSRRPAKRVSKP